MRKNLLVAFLGFLSFAHGVFSQNIGIGTNNPQNKLHVAGGFRLDTLANGVDSGLLRHDKNGVVYSLKFSDDTTSVIRGNGTLGSVFAWGLKGNAGTNTATNFIGTTDNKPLLFRVNNKSAGQINPNNLNTGFGMYILDSNTTGHDNAVVGFQTLRSNTIGNYNVAFGNNALFFNTTGNQNTAIGYGTLTANTSGTNNTAIGVQALRFNTTGTSNTACGINALLSNTVGTDNTATGNGALYSNTTGVSNTANGGAALYSNTTGSINIACGGDALFLNTSGNVNTAYGISALYSNTTGNYNTAVGYDALFNNTTAYYNTAIGYNAGYSHDNGYNNVFLGANTDVSGNGFYNVIAIGQAVTCTSSNQVRVGNSATQYYYTYANWTTISDGSYKKNIREDVPGIAFIKKLRPVTYNLDATALDNFLHKDIPLENQISGKAKKIMGKALKEKEQVRYTGFVAQEVEKSAKELGFDFSGVDAPKNKNDVYGLRYAEFVVPLVKAVQEQQAIIEKQQQQIDELKNEIELIKGKLK